jgi:ferrochelatase
MDGGYDALVVVSFGGPEARDEVIPFLEQVLRGRNVPRQRMEEVAHHYYAFDGVSPINEQSRLLVAALKKELDARGPKLPIYWGNRNWHPFLSDTVRTMRQDGVQNALAFVTSAYSSFSGCRQYLSDIEKARTDVGEGAPTIHKLRLFFNHPGFIEANADNLRRALGQLSERRSDAARLVYTAHSIPLSMASNCRYEKQLGETAALISDRVGRNSWDLVYQSRSGPPQQLWLEPDICDFLEDLADRGVEDVIVSPIGFVSDHMEVLYDLDREARDLAASKGMNLVRSATVGTHPTFVKMIRELVLERLEPGSERRSLGTLGAGQDFCEDQCCWSR